MSDAGRRAAAALEARYTAARSDLEDFWGRRHGLPIRASTELFGRTVTLHAADQCFVEALELAAPAYSSAEAAEAVAGPAVVVEAAVTAGGADPGPAPADLTVSYTGRNHWLAIDAGAFGHASVDLRLGQARIVIHPRLAEQPDLLRARLLDTVLLNLLTASGLGMLHASCLVRQGNAVLVLGDHGTGKTTTSLRAIESGRFQLLTDSMVFVDTSPLGTPRLHGFPVGRMKLRQDVARSFLERTAGPPALAPERVRHETKHVLDLAAWAPHLVHPQAVTPARTCLCLLRRSGEAATSVQPADGDQVAAAVVANSLFYDEAPGWRDNLDQLCRLLNDMTCVHLSAGTDADQLVDALQQLSL